MTIVSKYKYFLTDFLRFSAADKQKVTRKEAETKEKITLCAFIRIEEKKKEQRSINKV